MNNSHFSNNFMKKNNKFNIYDPIYASLGVEPVYFGELFGLSHEAAKKQYDRLKAEGFYDGEDY